MPADANGAATAALDHTNDLIVVLDGDGTIVLANAAWRAGAERRGVVGDAAGCGVNYVDLCERSDAGAVAAGVRAVLLGERPRFELDYPFSSPQEDEWYALEVVPLGEPGLGAVVTHNNVTARTVAARQHRGRDVDPVTMLATSAAGVPGLAQKLADAQARTSSLAVVTITLMDLADIEARHGRRGRDELVVHVVSRLLRLARGDDAIFRASTSKLVVIASVADAAGGEFLRSRITEVLSVGHLVGPADIEARIVVDVTTSDRFSTIDSLLHGTGAERAGRAPVQSSRRSSGTDGDLGAGGDADAVDEAGTTHVPLVVYDLPDGVMLAANEPARLLFGLNRSRAERPHAREIADPVDAQNITVALAALSSGATDSYRAHRTLETPDGPLTLMTSVRRLVIGAGALAVVLTVPAHPDETTEPEVENSLAVAPVAGTIDARGEVLSVSAPGSAMESELVGALGATLQDAAHPDEVHAVETLLVSMRERASAVGPFRVSHSERGWVECQCQLFTIARPSGPGPSAGSPGDAFAFVLSADIGTTAMVDTIARLERHIRRIGSEVHAADLGLTVRPLTEHRAAAALDQFALSARQRDIVERLVDGQRVASIAAALYISRSTVRNHLAQVYRLVGVHSQEELLNALRA